jgi:hypothetical protein
MIRFGRSDAGDARPRRYSAHRYDDDLLLKTPPLLWLAMVFLVRHVLLLGITFLPTTGPEIAALRAWVRPEDLLAALPALPVLLVALRRRRPCAAWMASLWQRGREVLTLSVLLDLLLVLPLPWTGVGLLERPFDEAALIAVLMCLAVLGYLWRSPLVADVFDDCPVRGDP